MHEKFETEIRAQPIAQAEVYPLKAQLLGQRNRARSFEALIKCMPNEKYTVIQMQRLDKRHTLPTKYQDTFTQ
jgi:hypothetical protein